MVSEAGQIIQALVQSGVNYESIGQAVGRNRSLIRQVAIGSKPGNNLRDSLAALRDRLAGVTAPEARSTAARAQSVTPPRRQTKAGTVARTRRKTTYRGAGFSTSRIKRQAASHGGRGLVAELRRAAEQGRSVAVTIGFSKRVQVMAYGKSKRARAGRGGSLDIELGDAEQVLIDVVEGHGGNFTEYVIAEADARGHLGTAGVTPEDVDSIELRTY